MPRKSRKKKRGGSKLANSTNSHNPLHFGSDQGLVTGCAGCQNGNIEIGYGCNLPTQAAAAKSATIGINSLMNGIRGQVGNLQSGGGNVAETSFQDLNTAAQNGMGYGSVPVTSVQNCGVTSSTSMGAGQRGKVQSGGGDNTASCVYGCNNLGPIGYGLNVPPTNKLNALMEGSGYPIVSPYNTKKCGGRRKKRRRKRKKHRRTKRKVKRRKRHTRRKRGGGVSRSQKIQQKMQSWFGFPPQLSGGSCKKHRRRKGGHRKTQKGGYHQYRSNRPNAPSFSSPTPGPRPWATGPLSKTRTDHCQDNYNHYTGKSSPSPVTDGAAPITPFGGTA